jgi:peptidoglycan/LPS O-acetylase OafA/YrhL
MQEFPKYRKDIDGLRAIAILSVVIFHLNDAILPGGFVGVDIFFVISGFLITKIIIREIDNNNFSFTRFYIRRIRRILPVFFVVLLCCTIFAALIFSSADMILFGRTLRYSAVALSNFLFQKEVGYFDPTFETSSLLHSWSLAVEEQFYFIWPVVLVLLFKFRKNQNLAFYSLILLSIISLAISQYLVGHDVKLAFFSLLSRFWELGIGAILAFNKIKQPSKNISQVLGFLGLFLIIFSFFATNREYFPGFYALIPCFGCALVIFSGNKNQTFVSGFLSNKLFIFFGLISYSFYLWHFPIIAFYKNFIQSGNLTLLASIAIFAISTAISYFSYKYIETPFRKKSFYEESSFNFAFWLSKGKNKTTIKLYYPIVLSLIIIALFVVIAKSIERDGWQWRLGFSAKWEKFIDDKKLINGPSIAKGCFLNTPEVNKFNKNYYSSCSEGNGSRKILVIGDSHMRHYSKAIMDRYSSADNTITFLGSSGCPIAFNTEFFNFRDNQCAYFLDKIKETLAQHQDIESVIIAGRYDLHLGWLSKSNQSESLQKEVFSQEIENTIKYLTKLNKKIVILGQVPQAGTNRGYDTLNCMNGNFAPLKKLLSKNQDNFLSNKKCTQYNKKSALKNYYYLNNLFTKMSSKYKNVEYFDPTPYFCDDIKCHSVKSGKVLYKDGDHLNIHGSEYIGQYFDFKL